MGKTFLLLASAMLCATALAGCGGTSTTSTSGATDKPAIAEGKGAILGLVIDDRYRPIPGALVLLTPAGLTATADGEGQFQITDLEPGAYEARVTADGHEAAPTQVDVVAGQYTDVEISARRVFSTGGSVVTTQYSVFVPCAASAPAISTTVDCTGDQSGDTFRAAFHVDYTPYGSNVTYLITEMLANHKASPSAGAFKVVVRDVGGGDPYFSSKYTIDSDYIRLLMPYGQVSPDDAEPGRNQNWTNKVALETAFFPQGQFKGETQTVLDAECGVDPLGVGCFESRGLGAQAGVKAKFVQTLFLGPPDPSIDINTYAVLAHS